MKRMLKILKEVLYIFIALIDFLWLGVLFLFIPIRWILIISSGLTLIVLIFVHTWYVVGIMVGQISLYYFLNWVIIHNKMPSKWLFRIKY